MIEVISTFLLFGALCFGFGWLWGDQDRKRVRRRCRALENRYQLVKLKLGIGGIEIEDVPAVPEKVIPGKPATVKILRKGRP